MVNYFCFRVYFSFPDIKINGKLEYRDTLDLQLFNSQLTNCATGDQVHEWNK